MQEFDIRRSLINERTLCENFGQRSVLCFLWMRLLKLEMLFASPVGECETSLSANMACSVNELLRGAQQLW